VGADLDLGFKVSVDADAAAGSQIVNKASFTDVNTPKCDAGPSTGTCWTNTVRNPIPCPPNPPVINVKKVDTDPGDGKSVTAGKSTITYDLDLTNTGGSAATDVVVTDAIPDGSTYVDGSATCNGAADCTAAFEDRAVTFTLASVAAGAHLDLGFQVSVNAGDKAGSDIKNKASFTDVNTPKCDAGPTAGTCWTNRVHNPVECPPKGGQTTLTIGYWKNHEAATTGLLPQTLGDYAVNGFEQAHDILANAACSRPINCMAAQMLGALLNVGNGMPDVCIADDIKRAQALLRAVNYHGPDTYALEPDQAAEAKSLHDTFDSYNSDKSNPC
jgi:uncharacterized repeat protein (TIGR01451 family)